MRSVFILKKHFGSFRAMLFFLLIALWLSTEHSAQAQYTKVPVTLFQAPQWVFRPVNETDNLCQPQVSLQDLRLEPLKILFNPQNQSRLFCVQPLSETRLLLEPQFLFFWSPSEPGGNSHGARWELSLPRSEFKALNTIRYPFLKCENFQAHRYCGWNLKVQQNTDLITISASNIAQPCKVEQNWQAILDEIASQFKRCEQIVRL